VIFVDQAGFYPFPPLTHTYAPRGQTPIITGYATRDHLSAICGLTLTGELLRLDVQAQAFKGPDVVRFLRQLVRQVAGPLTVIWDGAPIHRGQAVRAFLASPTGHQVEVVQLPGYAPDLNPAEGVWEHLKGTELANVCCDDLAQLWRELHQAKQRLRQRPAALLGCVKQPGFYV
jgi:putative transposase